jgi:hypothetical protein
VIWPEKTRLDGASRALVHRCVSHLHLMDEWARSAHRLGRDHSKIIQMDCDQHSQRRVQLSLSLRDQMHFTKGLRCRNSAEAGCSTEVLALAGGRSRAPLPPSPRKPYSVMPTPQKAGSSVKMTTRQH